MGQGAEAQRLIAEMRRAGRITVAEAELLAPDMFSISDFSPEALKAWLGRMLEVHGMTASVLAREAGLQPSSLLRFLKGETLSINSSTLDVVIKVLRERPGAILRS